MILKFLHQNSISPILHPVGYINSNSAFQKYFIKQISLNNVMLERNKHINGVTVGGNLWMYCTFTCIKTEGLAFYWLQKSHLLKFEWGAVLEKETFKVIDTLKDLSEGHILYFFENMEKYIKNVIDFVISGLEQNQFSIIIENDRIIPLLKKSLSQVLSESQLNKVRFVNNFDFYFAKGDFRCTSIFEFLPSVIKDYAQQGFSARSWAHVEWRDEREVHKKLSDSEKEADIIVSEKKLFSVCAYDSDRISKEIKGNLLTHHKFLMNDQGQ